MNRAFLAVIAANTIVLAAGFIDPAIEHHLEPLHNMFLAAFVCEIAWRIHKRERGGWLAFDSAVIALSILPAVGESLTILRLARLARLTHTARHLKHVAHLRAADILNKKGARP